MEQPLMYSTWSEAVLMSATLLFYHVSSPIASNDLFNGNDVGQCNSIRANSQCP